MVNLSENHRQGNDKEYGDWLNRMMIGEETKEDLDLLQTRIRPPYHHDLKEALYIA